MANIKLTLPAEPFSGQIVTFTAPCDCDKVTDGIVINGETYTICDAMGNKIPGTGGVWCSGAQISVVLDCENKKAYLQNGNPTLSTIGAGMVNPNLLHNWYFAHCVNQRGGYIVQPNTPWYTDLSFSTVGGYTDGYYKYTPYNTACGSVQIGNQVGFVAADHMKRGYDLHDNYGIDCWKGFKAVLTVKNGSCIELRSRTSDAVYGIYQMLEQYDELNGKTCTFSAIINGTLYSCPVTIGDGNWIDFGDNMRVISTDWAHIYIRNLAVDSVMEITAVKLELGSTQTLAHQDTDGNWVLNEIPDYNEELLKCCMSKADPADDYANNKKTPAAINAVSKDGDVLTNALTFTNPVNDILSRVYNDGEGAALEIFDVNNGVWDTTTTRKIQIMSKSLEDDFRKALRFGDWSTGQWHNILHTGNMESLGCGRIATGSYVGTGCSGSDCANTLTFSFKPALVVVIGWDTEKEYGGSLTMVQGASASGDTGAGMLTPCDVTWDGNSVSWSYISANFSWRQYNAANTTYHWFAIG